MPCGGCGGKHLIAPENRAIDQTIRSEFGSQPNDSPSPDDPVIQRRFWRSVRAYTIAVYEWLKAGKPTRNAEEMQVCFTICQSCPNFINIDETRKRGRCAICGCYLGVAPHRFLEGNKIAMRTQKCPEGKWE
ncbi:MAG: hypothetical protein Q4D38_00195 [Planctomycetia bacterium]|nr:hypothetical protein [Planctomycetia bacterium]